MKITHKANKHLDECLELITTLEEGLMKKLIPNAYRLEEYRLAEADAKAYRKGSKDLTPMVKAHADAYKVSGDVAADAIIAKANRMAQVIGVVRALRLGAQAEVLRARSGHEAMVAVDQFKAALQLIKE